MPFRLAIGWRRAVSSEAVQDLFISERVSGGVVGGVIGGALAGALAVAIGILHAAAA